MELTTSPYPIKLFSIKQEQFAQAVASGQSANSSYEEIYKVSPKQASSNSTRLLNKPNVQERIKQLQAQRAAANDVTVQSITATLRDAYALSMETKQASAASQAALGLAKLHGLIVDKSQVEASVRRPASTPDAPEEMTEEEWMSKFGGSASPNGDTTVN